MEASRISLRPWHGTRAVNSSTPLEPVLILLYLNSYGSHGKSMAPSQPGRRSGHRPMLSCGAPSRLFNNHSSNDMISREDKVGIRNFGSYCAIILPPYLEHSPSLPLRRSP